MLYAVGDLGASLEQRYDGSVRAALLASGTRAPRRGWVLRLPPALRETMVELARRDGARAPGQPDEPRPPAFEPVAAFYCERMPRMLVDQLLRGEDQARRLLWRPLDLALLPRFSAALHGLYAALAEDGLDARQMLGARDPEELVAQRPCVAALAASTVLGSGLPMLGAYPSERELLNRELSARPPEEVLDLRLSGNLVHELAHGPRRELSGPPPPWILLEAAALLLGARAFPRHVFPDVPGEAVPGVSLFVLLGQCLARLFGQRALTSLVAEGRGLREAFGERAARALAEAGWQDFEGRRELPFARDALRAVAWVKLADAARAQGPLASLIDACGPGLLDAADRLPFSALPWAAEAPNAADREIARTGVLALFQTNSLAPTFQTHPAEVPSQRLVLDVDACLLSCAARPQGVFAEPARWIFPPPLCRLLRESGARTVVVEGAVRALSLPIADALVDLALARSALQTTAVLRWTSSAQS